MKPAVVIFCVVVSQTTAFILNRKAIGCTADANTASFPHPDPLFLRPGKTYDNVVDYETTFVLPDQKTGLLTFQEGESVRIACPGNTVSASSTQEITVTCSSNNNFKFSNGTSTTIGKLACKNVITNVALRKDKCVNGGTGVNLGFKLGNEIFPLVYTCFDETSLVTYYSMERVPAELAGYESGENSPDFRQDDFYGNLKVDQLYAYDNQMVAFTKLLGSKDLAAEYLKDRTNYFIARGHFAPRADFVLGAHTRATFHFINAAGQWQIFNGGVWENLENSVRNYAIKQGTDLIAYTGPWGILEYPDINGNPVQIYLANPGTSSQTLQVPKFYWKVVYDPATKRGVAFVGINDPYVDEPRPDSYVLCDDVINDITWVNVKDPLNLLYACTVEEFSIVSDIFPKLDVSGGLLVN